MAQIYKLKIAQKDSRQSVQKDRKNKSSRALTFDYQRLHRIELRTVQLLNHYIHQVEHNNGTYANPNPANQPNQKLPQPKFQQIRKRYFSFSQPQNDKKIFSQVQQFKNIYQEIYQSEKKKKTQKKLNKVKTSSQALDKEIKSYEKNVIENLKNLNCHGNEWVELNKNSEIKKLWRKKNLTQLENNNTDKNEAFFVRNMTTDYDIQRKRILLNLKNLHSQSLQKHEKYSKSQKNFCFTIEQKVKQKQISSYERQNKFVNKAWNSNLNQKRSMKSSKVHKSIDPVNQSLQNQNKQESIESGMKLVDLSKFYGQNKNFSKPSQSHNKQNRLKIKRSPQKLQLHEGKSPLKSQIGKKQNKNIEQPLKQVKSISKISISDKNKNSIQTLKKHEIQFRLLKQKGNIFPIKNTRKLVL